MFTTQLNDCKQGNLKEKGPEDEVGITQQPLIRSHEDHDT